MENKQKTYNFNSVDLLIYIWKKKFILIIVGILAGVSSILVSLSITPMYKSSVVMFPTSSTSVARTLLLSNSNPKDGVYDFGDEQEAEQLLQVLHSEPLRSMIIEKYNLMEHYGIDPNEKYPRTRLLETYLGNVTFRLTEYQSVEIVVMDKDPVISAAIANDICDLVDTVYRDMKRDRALGALNLIETEYIIAQENLLILEDSIRRFGASLRSEIDTDGNPTNNFLQAIAEYGVPYMHMLNASRQEMGVVMNLRYRTHEARFQADQTLPNKYVVERAVPSEKKAYPNKSLIVIVSVLATLLFSLIIMIVIDSVKARMADMKVE
jgi:uncharacterized protein involved in exopolysaccharide biosynthesis